MTGDLPARTTELELRYTHLQQLMEDLNEVVIHQGRRMDQLERKLTQLAERLDQVEHAIEAPRDPAAEKPPHY